MLRLVVLGAGKFSRPFERSLILWNSRVRKVNNPLEELQRANQLEQSVTAHARAHLSLQSSELLLNRFVFLCPVGGDRC